MCGRSLPGSHIFARAKNARGGEAAAPAGRGPGWPEFIPPSPPHRRSVISSKIMDRNCTLQRVKSQHDGIRRAQKRQPSTHHAPRTWERSVRLGHVYQPRLHQLRGFSMAARKIPTGIIPATISATRVRQSPRSNVDGEESACVSWARIRKIFTMVVSQASETASHVCQRASNPLKLGKSTFFKS